MSRIFVTGMGIISAIGRDLVDTHGALTRSKTGIKKQTHFPSRYAGLLPFGMVTMDNDELREQLQVNDPSLTRTTLLALHAARAALADAAFSKQITSDPGTALIGATTVGGMCLTDELYQDVNTHNRESPFLSSYDCASVFLYLQQHFQINGIVNTINTACSSSANAIAYGARLIKNGLARRAIVGGADCLSKFTINGFNALQILSSEWCTPFDESRKGLNLGEGAAFLVLEREEDCKNKKIYAEIKGYHTTSDAYHPSSLSENGEGPMLAMKGALESAGLQPAAIDYINAHGTATGNNDEAESRAMIRVFEEPPAFASTKSFTGHTLGAAGAVEAVFSILNIIHQDVYPNLNFEKPIPGPALVPVTKYDRKPIQNTMSNSFGFGGNCTSLIFSKA